MIRRPPRSTLFPYTDALPISRHAMWTVAIVSIKIICDKTVHALRDAVADPGLEHLAPVRIVQAGPILAHAANVVVVVSDRFPEFIFFEQLKWVRDGFRAKEFFVPLSAIEPEK